MLRTVPAVLLVFGAALTAADSGGVLRVGPGVSAPRLLRKVEPEYTPEARGARVQGTVILQVVVNEEGRATDISVISPLGFGLDEQAQAAVEKWEFAPGVKDGDPVKILATVEVNFRFPGVFFDEKAERQRSHFNLAWENINRGIASAAAMENAVRSILALCKQKFVPAIYVVGLWKIKGEHVDRNVADGLDYIQKAAGKNFGPALYETGLRRIEGRDLPVDTDLGFEEMRSAARLGSKQAQFYLADHYEVGQGVPRDLERARSYYRLCSAEGVALCRYRLARLLDKPQDRPEREHMEAVALFQLAAEQGLPEARQAAAREVPTLTAEQTAWVAKLKGLIVRK